MKSVVLSPGNCSKPACSVREEVFGHIWNVLSSKLEFKVANETEVVVNDDTGIVNADTGIVNADTDR